MNELVNLTSVSDIYALLDVSAAGTTDFFHDQDIVTFGNVNTDHKRRDFREENQNDRGDFNRRETRHIEVDSKEEDESESTKAKPDTRIDRLSVDLSATSDINN